MRKPRVKRNILITKYKKSPKKLPGSFWGITTFFNPLGHINKYEHYKVFRANSSRQGLKLLVVELAFDDHDFEIRDEDAEMVVRVRIDSRNVIWQKEALLNIGLKNLPADCDKVAWIDCDIIFQNENWVKDTIKLLESYKVVQPFQFMVRMSEGVLNVKKPETLSFGFSEMQRCPGVVYEEGRRLMQANKRTKNHGHPGYAWAARREVLNNIGFYDLIITGSADRMMSEAFLNLHSNYLNKYSRKMVSHYKKWSREMSRRVQLSVSSVPGHVLHLWHGDAKNRNYQAKEEFLTKNDFDPEKDIKRNVDGVLTWASEKKDLHEALQQSFLTRREGGSEFNKRNFIPKFPQILPGSLWGITSFFNPEKFNTKYENYKKFRESSIRQNLKLVAVELVFDDEPFELKKGDAEVLVQVKVSRNNIMWHKEALLNIALKHLPTDCDKVAWLDCDIIFKNENWVKETSERLENYNAVQLFSWQVCLGRGVYDIHTKDLVIGEGLMQRGYGIAYSLANFGYDMINAGFFERGHPGFGWAIRRNIIDKWHFYDRGIIGNGDVFMSYAFYNLENKVFKTMLPGEAFMMDYLAWRDSIYQLVQKSVFYIDGYVLHLWHGDKKDRRYSDRNILLKRNSYNPDKDIIKDKNGVWNWASDKKRLHLDLKRYYMIRNEDGRLIARLKNYFINLDLVWNNLTDYLVLLHKFKNFSFIFLGKIGRILKNQFPVLYKKLKPHFPDRTTGIIAAEEELNYSNYHQYKKKIFFDNLTIFSSHRSGWRYAILPLRGLYSKKGIFFESYIDKKFIWGKSVGDALNNPVPIKRPWIGFFHSAINYPIYKEDRAPEKMFASEIWRQSEPACRGIFCLSRYQKEWLEKRVRVPVVSLIHPTETPKFKFNIDNYIANDQRMIIQVGTTLRRASSIYMLPTKILKKGIQGADMAMILDNVRKERKIFNLKFKMSSVQTIGYVNNHQYDFLLSKNIVFLDLWDVAACNTIIECIVRNTPVLVNPLPAAVEYLGTDYPFYFSSLEEAAEKAENIELVRLTSQYLANYRFKEKLTARYFLETFVNSEIYKSL